MSLLRLREQPTACTLHQAGRPGHAPRGPLERLGAPADPTAVPVELQHFSMGPIHGSRPVSVGGRASANASNRSVWAARRLRRHRSQWATITDAAPTRPADGLARHVLTATHLCRARAPVPLTDPKGAATTLPASTSICVHRVHSIALDSQHNALFGGTQDVVRCSIPVRGARLGRTTSPTAHRGHRQQRRRRHYFRTRVGSSAG